MRVLLLNPKTLYENWPAPSDFWRCFARVASATLPQLAAAISADHHCELFNGVVDDIGLREYGDLLSRQDVVGINVCASNVALNTEITARLIKRIAPQTRVVLGGHHATAYHDEWLSKGADIVVRGEGELTFAALIDALQAGQDLAAIDGISYHDGHRVVTTPERAFISDLDTLPMPRWELHPLQRTRYMLGGRWAPMALVETSRGCTHRCIFCSASAMWRHTQRYKSPGSVLDEIAHLVGLGVNNIGIADDNFGSNYDRDMEILERLASSNLDVNMWMFCRADTTLEHPEFVETAARAGLKEVLIGYESTDEEMLSEYHKGSSRVTGRDYERVYRTLRNKGVLVFGSFIDGSPLEGATAGSRLDHSDLCDVAMYLNFFPMRETRGYELIREQGLLATDSFYYDRLIPSTTTSQALDLEHLARQILGIASPRKVKQFALDRPYRASMLNIYLQAARQVACVTPSKLRDFLTAVNPWISPAKRQSRIVRRYTDEPHLDALWRRARPGAPPQS